MKYLEFPPIKIGYGYDVHRLVKDRELILGGIKIEHSLGLDGHSDADVLIHALMDAILGALGEDDIGELFPDNDDQYKGISSVVLLKEVLTHLEKKDYFIGNIDITVVAQRPKLKPYREKIREKLSRIMEIPSSLIGIKFTTEEKLGFTGREEGISATAVCLLYHNDANL